MRVGRPTLSVQWNSGRPLPSLLPSVERWASSVGCSTPGASATAASFAGPAGDQVREVPGGQEDQHLASPIDGRKQHRAGVLTRRFLDSTAGVRYPLGAGRTRPRVSAFPGGVPDSHSCAVAGISIRPGFGRQHHPARPPLWQGSRSRNPEPDTSAACTSPMDTMTSALVFAA